MFAGPTYAGLSDRSMVARAGFRILEPARRGDVQALLSGEPGLLVLVDGRFDQTLAVGHAELRRALELGWQVWGLSSMGAIRAFEMRFLGMRGFGRVYEHFLTGDDFQDDEVALLHSTEEPYTAFSEPLIHLRYFLYEMEKSGEISADLAWLVADSLKRRWFGDRTLAVFFESIHQIAGVRAAQAARNGTNRIEEARIKIRDLQFFLESSPWLDPNHDAIPTPCPYLSAVTP